MEKGVFSDGFQRKMFIIDCIREVQQNETDIQTECKQAQESAWLP